MSIRYEQELNPAQWEAVRSIDGPLLVIAGAGSGKTRTIVYRLAYLVQNGVPPEAILLLTFTRKASQEMLMRAGRLLEREGGDLGAFAGSLANVRGGTFHSFAYRLLRRTPPPGYTSDFTIMDRPDAEGVLREVKAELGLGKGDRSYPKIATVLEALGKARNKELEVSEVLARESFHLSTYTEDFLKLEQGYREYKRRHQLVDYDDLLFCLEELLLQDEAVRDYYRGLFQHIMIDEYQDTNLVQARLVRLLCPQGERVMAVGDDAQSIYAFRGANVRNILDFPKLYAGAKVVKLEQNYRSVQPILDLTNEILAGATAQFKKSLYSERRDGPRPELLRPLSDRSQATLVLDKLLELLRHYPPGEVAVLFRAGYQSYHVETQLARLGIAYRKYGGLRFSEAAHVKDVLAYLRCVRNPGDRVAWQRLAGFVKGVGQKTALKIHDALLSGDQKTLAAQLKRYPELQALLDFLHGLRAPGLKPAALLERVLEFNRPYLHAQYPDDYPRREKGLEELAQIAATYADLDQLLGDLSLEQPEQREEGEALTLSTIHQAKGLEWQAVLVIDLVEERFPSRHAMNSVEDYEEERRLLYVACTRAKDYLGLFAPKMLYKRGQEYAEPAQVSPFLREVGSALVEELHESHVGGLRRGGAVPEALQNLRGRAYAGSGLSGSGLGGTGPGGTGPGGYSAERSGPGGTGYGGAGPGGMDYPEGGHVGAGPGGGRETSPAFAAAVPTRPEELPHCRHKIFGRGKIVAKVPPNKYRVNFPGFGLKVIVEDYLELEG